MTYTYRRLVSSNNTAHHKRSQFPIIVLAFATVAVLVVLGGGPLLLALFMLGIGIVGGIGEKKRAQSLVDEVYDYGNFLLVRHEGREWKIPLAEIVSVRKLWLRSGKMDGTIRLKMKDGTKIEIWMEELDLFSAQNKDLWYRIFGTDRIHKLLFKIWFGI